jgi:hypothetical protein
MAHAEAEGIGQDPGGGELGELTELALHRSRLPMEELERAQAHALEDDAPLRALSAVAQGVVATGSFTGDTEPTYRTAQWQQIAGGVVSIASSMVRALGIRGAPVTDTPNEDAERVSDGDVSDASLQEATRRLARAMGTSVD